MPSSLTIKRDHHSGPCVPGIQRLFVDVEGNLYPCERVSEASKAVRMGHIDTGFDIDKARALLNIGKLTEKECKQCFVLLVQFKQIIWKNCLLKKSYKTVH